MARADVLNNLAIVQWELRRQGEARHSWRLALAAAPRHADALVGLGVSLEQEKRWAEVCESPREQRGLSRALRRTPVLALTTCATLALALP